MRSISRSSKLCGNTPANAAAANCSVPETTGTEVPMVPAVPGVPGTAGHIYPDQLDGRTGGIPDSGAAGPERADAIVDFSAFAGNTLILHNHSPAPIPAFDPRIDCCTGDMDQVQMGGAPPTLPGYGPNTRIPDAD